MGAPDRNSLATAFHERVKDWSYGRWVLVILALSVVVTVISALVREL